MATLRIISRLDVIFDASRKFFQHKMDQMRDALAKRKVYRATFYEISALTDRDLKDLGIARSNIKRLSLEAAYGL